MSRKQHACIIGAGTAGLCALKHALEQGMDATAYDQSDVIGGTWVYNENTNVPYDDEVHSSMYEGLRTNLPKEVMGYPDFNYSENIKESFISASKVLNFLESYAEHFELLPHIKLQHKIIRVRPWKGAWEVYIQDITNNRYFIQIFDYVFVCNGHYTTPIYPQLDGMDIYGGNKLHSHFYRKPDMFENASVLIIGVGPSAMDIAYHIYKKAKHVYISHHMEPAPNIDFMRNVSQKPDVQRFTETGAIFSDNTCADFSHVIYCTGYKYTFPFLSLDCGLHVDDNFVQPLYKHCININEPTMAIIGLPHKVCPTHVCDLQVRFALKFFTQQMKLPSRAEMLEDTARDMEERWANGLCKRKAHEMGRRQFTYYNDLAETAGIAKMKPVIAKMMLACSRKYYTALDTYRDSYFTIVDEENFVKHSPNES